MPDRRVEERQLPSPGEPFHDHRNGPDREDEEPPEDQRVHDPGKRLEEHAPLAQEENEDAPQPLVPAAELHVLAPRQDERELA